MYKETYLDVACKSGHGPDHPTPGVLFEEAAERIHSGTQGLERIHCPALTQATHALAMGVDHLGPYRSRLAKVAANLQPCGWQVAATGCARSLFPPFLAWSSSLAFGTDLKSSYTACCVLSSSTRIRRASSGPLLEAMAPRTPWR